MSPKKGQDFYHSESSQSTTNAGDALKQLRKPLAGDVPISHQIDQYTVEGELFEKLDNQKVRCIACGHRCRINPGGRGVCQVRFNLNGKLLVPWGYVAALHVDPIEKKPFYHVFPGSDALTFGMLGCDLHCPYCQNWDISQSLRDSYAGRPPQKISLDDIIKIAKKSNATTMVSSYNEPLITSEWAAAIFTKARELGMMCCFVSNGNGTKEVLEYMRPHMQGFKVDLKSFNDKNYRKLGGVLKNVLETIRMAKGLGYWVEIVTLIVPEFNDSPEELREMAKFIKSVSEDTPWHVTAFHKDYKMTDPANTSAQQLIDAAEIGYQEGLKFVYAGNLAGNVSKFENTYCPSCNFTLIERIGYIIQDYKITENGRCPKCHEIIPGIWPKTKASVRMSRGFNFFCG